MWLRVGSQATPLMKHDVKHSEMDEHQVVLFSICVYMYLNFMCIIHTHAYFVCLYVCTRKNVRPMK